MNKRLGRGLDALIPSLSVSEEDQVIHVPLQQLRPNPYQPRKTFNDESIQELAQSIKEHGIIQPIIVRRSIKGYEIIAGERRWRAAQQVRLETVPVVARDFTDSQVMEIALIENLQREDLNALEIAVAYQRLLDEFSITQEELAEKVGKSRPHITNFLRLLQLPTEIQEDVSRGTLSMGHARAILAIKKNEEKILLAKKTIKEGWSVRQLEEIIKKLNEPDKKKVKNNDNKRINKYQQEFEDRLRNVFGTSVKIKNNEKNRGKIEIEFYSSDDLERILELLAR